MSIAMKVPAALATGSTVVIKPGELTPGGTGTSGVGKEGGRAGSEEFPRVKSVAVTMH